MTTFTIVKAGVHLVSALGVTKVLGDIIKTNTVVNSSFDKILVNAGSLVLGSMIVDKASTHVNEQIENVVTRLAQREDDSTDTTIK
jgi:glutaminase